MKKPAIQWESDVRLMTHPLMLMTMIKAVVITGLVIAALFSFLMLVMGEAETIPPLLKMVGICTGVLALLFVFVCLVFFGNKMRLRFTVDGKAAEAELIDKRASRWNKIAIVAGALTGRPGVAGAGLIAETSKEQRAVWSAIARAKYHPRWRAITLSNGWRIIVTLYCTAENYEAVADYVRAALAAQPKRAHKNPLPMLLLRTVLVAAACAPLFGLPDAEEEALFPAILVLCFAEASVWLIPLLSWAVLGGLVWLAAVEVLAQSEVRSSMFDGSLYRAYTVMGDDDYGMLVLAGLGAAFLIWHSVALLRGRIESGLMRDMTEMSGA